MINTFWKVFWVSQVFVIKRLICIEFRVFWERKEKRENWWCRRLEWATAHFESSVVIEEVCCDRVPLTCVATGSSVS